MHGADPRIGDFLSNRSLLVDSGNVRHSQPARVSTPKPSCGARLANLNLTRVISSP